jgi:rod shape-determining protein MreB
MGSMIVDIGGGTTEVAVISLGGIVVARSLRVAGDEMDEAIVAYARQRYNLSIGERMAEAMKHEIGSAYPLEEEITLQMRGRNLLTGLPQSVEVSSVEIREALAPPIQTIVDVVRDALDDTPPELVADLMEHGIMLAGGGALLRGLATRLAGETRMTVKVAKHPMACVARGAGLVLEDLDALAPVLAATQRHAMARG